MKLMGESLPGACVAPMLGLPVVQLFSTLLCLPMRDGVGFVMHKSRSLRSTSLSPLSGCASPVLRPACGSLYWIMLCSSPRKECSSRAGNLLLLRNTVLIKSARYIQVPVSPRSLLLLNPAFGTQNSSKYPCPTAGAHWSLAEADASLIRQLQEMLVPEVWREVTAESAARPC